MSFLADLLIDMEEDEQVRRIVLSAAPTRQLRSSFGGAR
jgi:hypothetical protein